MSQTITSSHLFKTDYPVSDSLPLHLPKPKASCKYNPRKVSFILTCSSFALEKNLKNRQASVIYYLWWFSWTAAGACNKDVVIHRKESVDS